MADNKTVSMVFAGPETDMAAANLIDLDGIFVWELAPQDIRIDIRVDNDIVR